MNDTRPDFDELVGSGLEPDEHARLRRVHHLLIEAGPPPELSARAQHPPAPPEETIPRLPRKYRFTAVAAAAAAAVLLFSAGYLVGNADDARTVVRTVEMVGPSGAAASLILFDADAAGNWPMEFEITGLAPLPKGQTYELWLTRDGKLADPCGTFTVSGETTTRVPLNAPYRLRTYDGWVVVKSGTTAPVLTTPTT